MDGGILKIRDLGRGDSGVQPCILGMFPTHDGLYLSQSMRQNLSWTKSVGIIFLPLLRSRHNIPPISEEGNSISEEGKLMNIRCPPNTLQIFSECFSMQYILIFRKCWFCIWKAGQLRSFYATEHALIALFCYLVLSLGLLSPQALL